MIRFWACFLIVVCFAACSITPPDTDKKTNTSSTKMPTKASNNGYLPQSIGRIDEMILVMGENMWKGAEGDTLRKYILRDYEGLPQSEPLFDMRQVDGSQMSNTLKKVATILVIGLENGTDEASKMVQEQVDRYKKKSTGDQVPLYLTMSDVWAAPQNVVYLMAKDRKDLKNKLKQYQEKIITQLYKMEDSKVVNNIKAGGYDPATTKKMRDKLNLRFSVPTTFLEALDTTNCVWLRMDENRQEAVSNLFVGTIPYEAGKAPPLNGETIISARDLLGKYVKSDTKGAYMYSDTILPFQFKYEEIDGTPIFKTMGLWRMKDDFIGGPFINYAYDDPKNNRIVMLDGFVYAPKVGKRMFMRRLDMMIRQVLIRELKNRG